MDASEVESLIRRGVAALQIRDGRAARALFEQVVDGGSPLPPHWFLLAQACWQAGDRAAAERALDRVLEQQPRHVGALIMKGDVRVSVDERAAASFYKAAINAAAHAGQSPPLLAAELNRVTNMLQELEGSFERQLNQKLAAAGVGETMRTPRFQMALDLMLGKKELFLQQPNSFYFPGLPQIQFYERGDFPFLRGIEAAVPQMQEELGGLLRDSGSFQPYVEHNPDRPQPANHLLGDPSWGAFYLWKNGEPVEENAARCPGTMAAISGAPMPRIKGRAPFALFSMLQPGTHIKPHTGLLNTRLICHIPLKVPSGCRLRVGNEIREWEEGKALIFDDSFEHEAWNEGRTTRVVLIFEIWRPEIEEEDRRALTAMFEAITDAREAGRRADEPRWAQ